MENVKQLEGWEKEFESLKGEYDKLGERIKSMQAQITALSPFRRVEKDDLTNEIAELAQEMDAIRSQMASVKAKADEMKRLHPDVFTD